jgi:hypothetical protein
MVSNPFPETRATSGSRNPFHLYNSVSGEGHFAYELFGAIFVKYSHFHALELS